MNVYDFDKTIYDGDSSVDFYIFCIRAQPSLLLCLPSFLWSLVLYGCGYLSKTQLKEHYFRFLQKLEDPESAVRRFWDTHIKRIRRWYLEKAAGDDLVITASPYFLISEACHRLQIQRLIASDVDIHTGEFRSPNCRGAEKVAAFERRYPRADIQAFYSDSDDDTPLAGLAQCAFKVRKDEIFPWPGKNGAEGKKVGEKGRKMMQCLSEQRCARWGNQILYLFCAFMIAAAAYHGFFAKWAFIDTSPDHGFEQMLDGTAARPYVYRRLVPELAKGVDAMLPEMAKEKLVHRLQKNDLAAYYAQTHIPEGRYIEYNLMYYMSFLAFFFAILTLRSILVAYAGSLPGTLAAFSLALLFPLLETNGGYYYDTVELLSFFLCLRMIFHRQWLCLCILVPLATWNKESFFFFLLFCAPFFFSRLARPRAVLALGGYVLISGLAYLAVHVLYSANPGGTTFFLLSYHIKDLFSLKTYFQFYPTYGFPLGDGWFLPHILLLLWVIRRSWYQLTDEWKLHAKIACSINITLYLLFCAPGELRDLSMLYPTLSLLVAHYIASLSCVRNNEKRNIT